MQCDLSGIRTLCLGMHESPTPYPPGHDVPWNLHVSWWNFDKITSPVNGRGNRICPVCLCELTKVHFLRKNVLNILLQKLHFQAFVLLGKRTVHYHTLEVCQPWGIFMPMITQDMLDQTPMPINKNKFSGITHTIIMRRLDILNKLINLGTIYWWTSSSHDDTMKTLLMR